MIIVKNKDFIVRTFQKSDAESVAKNMNNKKIIKNLTDSIPYPYRAQDAEIWIKLNQKSYRRKNPQFISFAIEINKKAVGGIGFHDIKKSHMAMMGYWLGEKYWGRGIMTRVVKETTNHGFSKLKLKRVYAGVFSFNKASMRVLGKAGFKLEGVLRKGHLKKGKFLDIYLYAKIK